MDNFNNDKKSSLERLQDELYSNDFKSETDTRAGLEVEDYKLKSDWVNEQKQEEQNSKPFDLSEEMNEKKGGMGFFSYILILATIFFIGSVGYAAYVFWGGDTQINAEDVDVSIIGPVSIGAGEILSLDLIIQNNNPVQLEAIDLIIEYPDGTKSPEDLITDLKRTKERIDPIVPGGVTRETLNAALFGEEGDNKEISVFIEYQALGSSAIFSKKKVFSIILNAAPARVSITGLEEISSGQEIELTATVTSNSNTELKKLMLVANYPFGFSFLEADKDPEYGNNVWVFDSISPNGEETIKIKGTISGQNSEERVFRFSTGIAKDENQEEIGVVFSTFIHETLIKKPFVGLNLLVNNSSDPIVSVKNGEKITSQIIFSNNTNDYIRNLDIRLKLDGAIFDESSVSSNDGFYRSVDNVLIFNRDTNDEFIEIRPRESSSSGFTFDLYDLSNSALKNPEIKINAYLEADRISGNNLEENLNETISKTIRIISDVFVGAYTIRDLGPFQNTGPIPPRAEQETTYTIQWSVSNSFNDLENARITAVLPPYVSWNNMVSPSSEVYSYDEKTRRLTWNIGNVQAGAGKTFDPKSIYFQVTLFPSVTQIGDELQLLRNVYFTAKDDFTGTDIEISGKLPTTKLNDSSSLKDHEIVVQ